MTPLCYFAEWAITPCDQFLMRCHIISQQILKREHQRANPRIRSAWFEPSALTGSDLQALLDDPRNWRWGCWRHHQHVDGPWGSWAEIPESAHAFAAEYELENWLPELRLMEEGRR